MEYTHQQLEICIEGRDEVVRSQCEPLDPGELIADHMQTFFDDMIEAMIRYNGIGIAAPQVGYPVQAAIIHEMYAHEFTGTDEHLVIVNPRIVSASPRSKNMEEGCLSVPNVFGDIERAAKVRVKALDRNGNQIDIKTKSFLARVLQHEIEHLYGTLYIDNATNIHERTATI